MRLTLKLTLSILIGVGMAWLLNVYLRVQREAHHFENDIKKDHVILGRVLSIDLLEEWRGNGKAATFELAAKMNAERDWITLTLVDLPAVPSEVRKGVERGEVIQHIGPKDPDDPESDEVLVSWVPLSSRDGTLAALRIEESTAPSRAYVRTTLERTGVFAAGGVVLCTALAFLIGFVLVGRPVRDLVAKARRVGDGDLTGPLPVGRNDELGVLAEELNAMCDRLMASRDQLRHADRLSTVGLLSAGIAHELGTPLNVVAGRARLIADGPGVDEAVARNAKVIEEQAHRMTKIVRQLLDFARGRRPAKAKADVSSLAKETAEMLSPLAQKRGVKIFVESDHPPLSATVDNGQIQQAITNLVVNAVQASPAGASVRLEVRAGHAPKHAFISVVDEGEGMDEETLKSVFTPFFTTKDVGEGTGLGLAVAWGLVQENGGHITVASEKGRGSTFTIHLPAESA